MQRKDYYGILGISRDAEQDEVKKAYRKLAFQFHPDTNEGDPKAEDRFKEINEAYDVLSNSKKRNLYDLGHDPTSQGRSFHRYPFGRHADPFEQAFFGNFGCRGGGFGRCFGRGRRKPFMNFSSPSQGTHFQRHNIPAQDITLTCAEAQSGTQRELHLHAGTDRVNFTVEFPPGIHDGALLKVEGPRVGQQAVKVYIRVKIVD